VELLLFLLRSPGFLESRPNGGDRAPGPIEDVHEQWQGGGGLLILHQLLSIHY